MEDPYTGLLQVGRNLTAQYQHKRQRDEEDKDPNKRPAEDRAEDKSVPDDYWSCRICLEPGVEGYRSPCCGKLSCAKCVHGMTVRGLYGWMFTINPDQTLKCSGCSYAIGRGDTRLLDVPPQALPRPQAAPTGGPDFVQGNDLGWNLMIVHHCGYPISLTDWTGCDLIGGGCHQCGQQPLTIIPGGGHNTFQAQHFWDNGLKQLRADGTPASFAALATAYPRLWQLLRLRALVEAVAAGARPDLSEWPAGARALLLSRAAEILPLLN